MCNSAKTAPRSKQPNSFAHTRGFYTDDHNYIDVASRDLIRCSLRVCTKKVTLELIGDARWRRRGAGGDARRWRREASVSRELVLASPRGDKMIQTDILTRRGPALDGPGSDAAER